MKKTVLKRVMVVLAVLIMAFGMTACGGGGGEESPYAGTYKATTAEYAGIELEIDSLFPGGFSIIIENGGKCSVDIEGEVEKGSWEEVDGVVVIEDELKFNVDPEAGTGTMDYEGVIMNFEKQ